MSLHELNALCENKPYLTNILLQIGVLIVKGNTQSGDTSSNQEVLSLLKDIKSELRSKYPTKGKEAEGEYLELLQKHFQGSIITFVGNQPGYTDILLQDPDNFSILLEIKRHQRNVPPSGVSKFLKDIETNNLPGILISDTSGISGKSDFQIERISNNFVVYLSFNDTNIQKIHSAYTFLKTITRFNQTQQQFISKEDLKSLQELFKDYIDAQREQWELVSDFYTKYKRKHEREMNKQLIVNIQTLLGTKF